MTSSALPDYDSPPVNEVVLGLTFQPLVSLRVVHFGLIWDRVRREYPAVQHLPPLGLEQTMLSQPPSGWGDLFFVPRVWFLSTAQDRVIQLQHDRFYVNWRSIPGGVAYPRY